MVPAVAKKGEIASLTGLRGVAALCVVLTHFTVWTFVAPHAQQPAWLVRWAQSAGIGMAIFFTLSGYVIALSYSAWDWRGRPLFSLVRLFFYRLARLYPAFLLFALLIVLRSPPLHDPAPSETQRYLLLHLALWQSWLPAKYGGALADASYFHVSWSLSTECALYLLFGLGAIAAALLPNGRYRTVLLAGAFLGTAWLLLSALWRLPDGLAQDGWSQAEWDRWLFYIGPLGVALQFGLGVAAFRISSLDLPRPIARMLSDLGGLGLIAVYLLVSLEFVRDAFNVALLTALAAAILMIGARADSVTNRLLARPAMVFIGTISYSLYLFHFAVPGLGFHGQMPALDRAAGLYSALNFAMSLVLAIALASGVYRLVEVPGRRLIRRWGDRLLAANGGWTTVRLRPARQ
jgi:peptidoglycan/LPS O-acetylase OafA/YrhL